MESGKIGKDSGLGDRRGYSLIHGCRPAHAQKWETGFLTGSKVAEVQFIFILVLLS